MAQPAELFLVRNKEDTPRKKSVETDPRRFIDSFRDGFSYRRALADFLRGQDFFQPLLEDLSHKFPGIYTAQDLSEAQVKAILGMLAKQASKEEIWNFKTGNFEHTHLARIALIESTEREVGFRYDPQSHTNGERVYPYEVQHAVENYLNEARKIKGDKGLGHTAVRRNDYMIALTFVGQGLVPTLMLGRGLGQLILVQEGVETLEGIKSR